MKKLFAAVVYLLTFAAPALIVQYYDRYIDPMTDEEIRIATIAGTLGVIVMAILTGFGRRKPDVSSAKSTKPADTAKATKTKKPAVKKTTQPKTRIVRDPATKAETIFKWNEDEGRWESDHGTYLDDDRMDEWEKQRISDRKWADDEMKKLRNRETSFDKETDAMIKKQKEELAKLEKEQKLSQEFGRKTGRYGYSEKEIREFYKDLTEKEKISAEEYTDISNEWERKLNYLEWVQWGADLGMDICDILTFGAGKPIKNAYIFARNTAGDFMDGMINRRGLGKTLAKTITKTTIDLTQANVNKVGYKYAANGIGDGIKEAISAAEEGKSAGWGFVKGTVKGTARTKIETSISKTKLPWTSKQTKMAEKATNKSLEVLGWQQSGQISQKVGTALRNKIRTETAAKIAAETSKNKDLLSTGFGTLSDSIINNLM